MRLPADYHMHTPLCRHAEGEPTEYAAHAAASGFTEIGFSDHSPMPQDDFDNWRMLAAQLEEYIEKVRQAQKDHPQLTIRLALEVDYLPEAIEWIKELSARHPWDYLIGSVHYISHGWDIDNPFRLSEWEKHPVDDVWEEYLERLTQAAGSGLFDIIGHCDLPKKFGHRPKKDCLPRFEMFLKTAAASDTAIELNTAGLRKDCREIYPHPAIVTLAQQLKVPITFGSDAHAPKEVGAGFSEAIALARQAGFTHWRQFCQRKKTAVVL